MDNLRDRTLIWHLLLCKSFLNFCNLFYYILHFITSLSSPEQRDAFGIIVSYAVKIKLFLGALGGEVSAELPFVLMNPKPGTKPKMIHADSQADVETFRQDTIMDPDCE